MEGLPEQDRNLEVIREKMEKFGCIKIKNLPMIKEILNKGKTQAMETKYNTQYMTIHIIIYNIQRNPIIIFPE